MYANITNPANFQLQDFAQFGFRVITTDFIPVPGEQYRTLYVLQDAVVTATTQKGDDITSKAILAGTLLHGLFNSVSITSGRVLAYAAGRVTAEEIIALYEAYVIALGGTLENAQCAVDTINEDGVDFFADASLVMIPEGYATGVVYGQRPLTSDSQLTFTRASDATRVGPDGAIEKVRTNLLLQSETFDNASWNKSLDGQVTITANAATAPNGTTTADKMIASAIAGFHCVQQQVTLSAGEASVSVYAKAAENSFLQIFDALTTEFVNFNLTTGVVGSSSVYVGSVEDAGNGWYRCKATKVVPSGTFSARIGIVTSATAARGESFTGNGTNGLLIWGAQLEYGVATDYIATTSAAVSVGILSNVPRIDYTGGGCGKLLLEPQRTNIALFSEQFDNATWIKVATTVTANNAVSPDGYTNADALVEDTATNLHVIYQAFVSTSSTAYTFSCYIKPSTRTRAYLRSDTSAGTVRTLFDLTGSGSVVTLNHTSASISLVGDDWYRCSITFTEGTGAAGRLVFVEGAVGTSVSYAGNGLTAFWLYGAQLEAGSYATSYIPTLGSSVTRLADSCSKTGISSLIGQTEGALYAEANIRANKDSVRALQASDGTINNRIQLAFIGNDFSPAIVTGGVVQAGITVPFTAGNNKFAIAYANNDVVAYLNGVQVLVDNSATIPTCSVLDVGQSLTANTNTLGDPISQALVFKTRLTNEQLQKLTSL